MIIDRRRLLKLIPLSGASFISGCDDTDEDKVARVERALETRKQEVSKPAVEGQKQAKIAEQETDDPTKRLIVYAAASFEDPFQRLQASLMAKAVRQLDGCRFKTLDGGGSAETQLHQLVDLQTQHPAFLVVCPVGTSSAYKQIDAIRKSGSVVIGVDEQLAPESCSAVVFVSQKKLGALAGRQVVEALKRKAAEEAKPAVSGRVVHLTGDAVSFAAKARSEGFHEALKAEPGIIVVHEAPGAWSREGGKARTEEALRLQHEFDVVCAHSEFIAQGAGDALSAAQIRDRVLLIGMNGGLEMVRKSIIDATILQPMPLQMAFEIIKQTLADPHYVPPAKTELQPEAVTPANLDAVIGRVLRGGK
ncbi:MAG: histidine kinase [Verrucomicrobiaceae bacterium]|nr:histidine kinase [Verrucomicrobiaceae bacterium]MDB6119577.1 histidine kinase [Verrucomicrobiaceae bacterium]